MGRWIPADELARAAARLARSREEPLIFLERRDDVRAEFGTGRPERTICTRSDGLAVEFGKETVRHLYVSDPGPVALAALSAGTLPERSVRDSEDRTATRELPPAPDTVRETVEALARAMPTSGTDVAVEGRVVALDQAVEVARPGWETALDSRKGERARIDVRVRRGGRVGVATAEWVRRRGRPPLDAGRLVAGAVERARERCNARPAPGGEHAAVFAPGVGGVLVHEMIGHALEADTVRRGGSRLGLADLSFASREVVVVDDPRRGRAGWVIDDEGETARPVALVRDGRVVGRLHDRRSARAAGTSPTGHARRASYLEPAMPRMGCTFLGGGTSDPEDILRSTRDGVYVRRMEAANVEPCSGIATFRVTDADRIRDGRIDHPLVPFVVEVNLGSTLSTLDQIASDVAFDTCVGSCLRDGQPLVTSVGAPTFRVGVITVQDYKNTN